MLLCCFCLQCMNVMIFVTNTLSGAIRINHHSWWSQKFRCQIKNSTVIEMKRIFFYLSLASSDHSRATKLQNPSN